MKKLFAMLLALAMLACGLAAYAEESANDVEEMDALLSGEWMDIDTQSIQMTITRNENDGWDVEAAGPLTHGGYIFKATIEFNDERNGFTYDNGSYWEVPITDSEEETDLGEPTIAGASGLFCFSGDDQNLFLSWVDDNTPEQETVFYPANANMVIVPEDFEGEWVGDVGEDGAVNVIITQDGRDYAVEMIFDVEEYTREYDMDFTAHFDPVNRWLASEDGTVMREIIRDENYDVADEKVVYEDGVSCFYFTDEGALVWSDMSSNPYDTIELQRPIGWIDPDYVGPGHHFVGEWRDDRVSVDIDEHMDGYTVIVSGANGASEGTTWLYACDYDEETDSLVSDGELAMKINYSFEGTEEEADEIVYEDGEAVFTINDEGKLIWDDKKENAGEDRAFERVLDGNTENASIDYGTSEIYTEDDMEEMVDLIEEEFSTWNGCELHALRYGGDELANEENLQYVNSMRDDKSFVDCAVFQGDFHSPVEDKGAWDPDTEYTDWNWWLAREEGGNWELITWGY